MPKRLHEFWLELLEEDPGFTTALVRWAGLGDHVPPAATVELTSGDLSEHHPTEYRADKVVLYRDESAGDKPVLAVIVESQTSHSDDKQWSWPAYVANLRARRKCKSLLVVLCPDDREAKKCRAPIPLGNPGSFLHPLVIGPREVPVITDPGAADSVADLLASAFVHGAGPQGKEVFTALLEVVKDLEEKGAYIDNILAVQPKNVARELGELMMTVGAREYKSDFARHYYGEGQAEGRAEGRAEGTGRTLLVILETNGVELTEEQRERITGCTDLEQLDAWVKRALHAKTADEVFG